MTMTGDAHAPSKGYNRAAAAAAAAANKLFNSVACSWGSSQRFHHTDVHTLGAKI
jgi:hypothetical protein